MNRGANFFTHDCYINPSYETEYKNVLDYGCNNYVKLPSSAEQDAQNQLMVDLKTAGVFAKLDTFHLGYVLDTSYLKFTGINWVSQSYGCNITTIEDTPDVLFLAKGGWTDNNSSLNINYFPPTHAVNFALNDWSWGFRCHSNASTMSGGASVIRAVNTSTKWSHTVGTLNRIYTNTVQFNWGDATFGRNFTSEVFTAFVGNGTSRKWLRNGSTQYSTTTGLETTLTNENIHLAHSGNGSITGNFWMAFIGGALTDTEVADFNTALNTYKTTIDGL